jgi:hypothetical protein
MAAQCPWPAEMFPAASCSQQSTIPGLSLDMLQPPALTLSIQEPDRTDSALHGARPI